MCAGALAGTAAHLLLVKSQALGPARNAVRALLRQERKERFSQADRGTLRDRSLAGVLVPADSRWSTPQYWTMARLAETGYYQSAAAMRPHLLLQMVGSGPIVDVNTLREKNSMAPIVSIVGKSHSGKTTLLEGLIPELRRRGYRVAVVKHHHGGDFEIDKPGKDSWRHARAGADAVMIVSAVKLALIQRVKETPSLSEIASRLPDADIILTEGFKQGVAPKIEVSRRERSTELISELDQLVAVAADHPVDVDVPVFALEDYGGLADLLEARFLS